MKKGKNQGRKEFKFLISNSIEQQLKNHLADDDLYEEEDIHTFINHAIGDFINVRNDDKLKKLKLMLEIARLQGIYFSNVEQKFNKNKKTEKEKYVEI